MTQKKQIPKNEFERKAIEAAALFRREARRYRERGLDEMQEWCEERVQLQRSLSRLHRIDRFQKTPTKTNNEKDKHTPKARWNHY